MNEFVRIIGEYDCKYPYLSKNITDISNGQSKVVCEDTVGSYLGMNLIVFQLVISVWSLILLILNINRVRKLVHHKIANKGSFNTKLYVYVSNIATVIINICCSLGKFYRIVTHAFVTFTSTLNHFSAH